MAALCDLPSGAADANPEGVAVVNGSHTLTYAELERRSNQLAHLLGDCGVARGDRVGLYLEKSAEAVVGIYGVLKRGAAYVPLDPLAPASRLASIARDCGIRCLVTGVEKARQWGALVREGPAVADLVVLNAGGEVEQYGAELGAARVFTAAEVDAQPDTSPTTSAASDELAYILYTSGSTGQPKGVMLSHRNALSFVEWAVSEFGVGAEDRLSNHAPLHFDLSIFDLFAASRAGAAVVLVDRTVSMFPVELARLIERERISIWYSVPSALTMLAEKGGLGEEDLPALRTVLFAGEVFPAKHLRVLMEKLPGARFCNLYGPTETNVCTWFDVPPAGERELDPLPIGKPIDGVETFAVTDDGRVARPGEVGLLHVAGPTVMMGYWGDESRTRERLVPGPAARAPAGLAYNTGDLVREDGDGNYLFLGRRDHQVKSRGYRIELGDVEAALLGHPSVVECAVVAIPDPLVTNRLRAAVVSSGALAVTELTRFCVRVLPPYMIPESFSVRDSLPKTSTGKIDRAALARQLN